MDIAHIIAVHARDQMDMGMFYFFSYDYELHQVTAKPCNHSFHENLCLYN